MAPIQEADYYYNSEPKSWHPVSPYRVIYKITPPEFESERDDHSDKVLCEVCVVSEDEVLIREKTARAHSSGGIVYDQVSHKLVYQEINDYFSRPNMVPSEDKPSHFKAIRWVATESISDYALVEKGRYILKKGWNWIKEAAIVSYQVRTGKL